MQQKKILMGVGILVVCGIAWYAFRPELLFVSKTVNEDFPMVAMAQSKSGPQVVSKGAFRPGAHKTEGEAAIYKLEDGKRVLRLTNFETSNGPNVHVYLVQANDVKDNATVKNSHFIDLGSIKGTKGDQNYDVPADVDLNTHRAVTIWCARFGVNFGTAALMPEGMKASESSDGSPVALSQGEFHTGAHKTEGKATIYKLGGKRVLRLTNFETSNGPDVHVYLVQANDVKDNATVKNSHFIDLGSIKGTKGDQNYDVPADVDLNTHKAVTIWCKRFGVNFGTAPLAPQQS
jgi:hypothetical protein